MTDARQAEVEAASRRMRLRSLAVEITKAGPVQESVPLSEERLLAEAAYMLLNEVRHLLHARKAGAYATEHAHELCTHAAEMRTVLEQAAASMMEGSNDG